MVTILIMVTMLIMDHGHYDHPPDVSPGLADVPLPLPLSPDPCYPGGGVTARSAHQLQVRPHQRHLERGGALDEVRSLCNDHNVTRGQILSS